MSLFAQIGIVILIILTGVILFLANRGLATAEAEGEHFVDEWALRQQKKAAAFSAAGKKSQSEERRSIEEKNGADVRDSHEKKEGPVLRCLRVEHPLYLTMLDDEQHVLKQITVDHVPYRIGRDGKNDLVLNDLSVAREHAQILEKEGEWMLQDLGTANKIYVEGSQRSSYELRERNRFYLGHYEFRVDGENHRSQPTVLAGGKERISL